MDISPERWQKIEQIYHTALEREPGGRSAFLDQACQGDIELRREVEALLAQDDGGTTLTQIGVGMQMGSYRIEALLGEGGMGVVYRAIDTKLNRPVAIKFLSNELADAETRRRFQREAQMASSLNHPHILTVHDIGEIEGRQYLVTEFVDGGTLKSWAKQEKRTWRQVVELLAGVADGLAAAHQAGILHRDIKPDNILISKSGYAKLADFGLAKLTEGQDETRTHAGIIKGTIAYMSPEQASAKTLDARSDIFSFGVVLYEILAGRRPFTGKTDLEVLQTIIHAKPQPLGDELPAPVRMPIEKALEKDPAERYQSMRDMVVDLRRLARQSVETPVPAARKARLPWIWVAAATVLLLAVVGAWKFWPHAGPPRIRSIAVLPLRNLSRDPDQELFSDGATEALISDLGQLHAFQKVISLTSVMRYKGTNKSLPQIGQELGVDAIVEGSVQRSGGRVRVAAQLIQASADTQLWAREFDRDVADVLTLESEMARAIADEIKAQLTIEEKATLGKPRPVNPKAYEAYLRGRQSWNKQTPPELKKAIEEFKQAIDEDPAYASGYAGLADTYFFLGWYGIVPPRDVWASAKAAAEKAKQIDPALAEAHVSLGIVKGFYDWDWPEAEREFKSAIALNPGLADAYHWYSHYLQAMHRPDEALSEIRRAEELDPLSPVFNEDVALTYYFRHEYDQALAQCWRLQELEPNFWRTYRNLGKVHEQKGMFQEAVAEFEKARTLSSDNQVAIAELAHAYASSGERSEARRLLKQLEEQSKRSYILPEEVAAVYAGLGENDRALDWLERAVANRAPRFAWIAKEEPRFDGLHANPRFTDLLRKVGLVQ